MFKMNKSKRLPEQVYTLVMWAIAVLFALFLTGLGGKIISDLPKVGNAPEYAQFESIELKQIQAQQAQIQMRNEQLQRDFDQAQLNLTSAQQRYQEEKQQFDNWIQTRTATGQTQQDAQVITRTQRLDQLQGLVTQAQQVVEQNRQAMLANEHLLDTARADTLREQAQKEYSSAQDAYDLKVFLWRLLLALPALVLAAWLFAKKRQSRYWPFVWGFVFFALIVFFVELVPYLPSYGGYVRYIVGIILVAVGGYYAIKQMQNYLRRKQEQERALSLSTQDERRQAFNQEQALTLLAKNVCPSCERPLSNAGSGLAPDYCVHCGLCVYKKCTHCGTRCSTFHQFCSQCGTTLNASEGQ